MAFTILLVEDDFDVREALAETLSAEGYEIHCACDGVEALDYLRGGGRPGLILLDLMMPRMDGAEFRQAQRTDPALAQVPVVLLSADVRVREKALALQTAGAVRKPINLPELLGLIDRFRQKSAAAPSPV
jgi:two-component system chemotaxis response regulator CheY